MELSFSELLLVALIGFLVLGPQELVRHSRQVGRWIGKMKTELHNFRILAEEQIVKADEAKKKVEKDLNSPVSDGRSS